MGFLCMYCKNPSPISLSVVDFKYHGSGPHAIAFFICPDYQNNFMVKIEDLGRVKNKNFCSDLTFIKYFVRYNIWGCLMNA